MAGEVLRIGLIGAGANTRLRHIPGFQEIDGVRIVSVANRRRASAEAVAKEYGIPRVADSWEAVADDPEVDAVCIGTWPNLHAPATLRALEAGKHVLTEARVAMNAEEADRMCDAARARPDQIVQVVPSPFTLDLDATVERILAEGVLGTVREIRVLHTTSLFLDPGAAATWRQRTALSGNNMLTMGIYHEVVQRWFPRLSIARVRGWGRLYVRERPAATDAPSPPVAIDVPDSLTVDGALEGGGRLHYVFSGIEAGPGHDRIELIGAGGRLCVDIAAQRLHLARAGGSGFTDVAVDPADKRGWRVESDFAASIREGAPVTLTSLDAALRYMRFTDAVRRSVDADGAWQAVL
ncbi:MAG: Gfo/Idh/MocA family oxidoreductase [Opitutales bacterium]|nr:Gfo/Idh/MocA family oxidoreductase [Opitutales bacterium]